MVPDTKKFGFDFVLRLGGGSRLVESFPATGGSSSGGRCSMIAEELGRARSFDQIAEEMSLPSTSSFAVVVLKEYLVRTARAVRWNR